MLTKLTIHQFMKNLRFLCASFALFTVTSAIAQDSFRFDFGDQKKSAHYIKVSPTDTLKPSARYGLHNVQTISAKRTGSFNSPKDDYITSSSPFFFSVKLHEGNYNVKLVTGDAAGTSDVCIKAECRRFMVQHVTTQKGEFAEIAFTVHIRDSVIDDKRKVRLKPRERNNFYWDDWLTLEFNGNAPKICSVEISPANDIPTVFLAGNSTVVDQAVEPWAAWGQMLPMFLQPGKAAVANYAESGETMLAFKRELRLEKIWSMAKKGDYLFMEFAHNDQKPGGNHLDPFTTYTQTIKEWISECRSRGVNPVLVTSMNRRRFDSTGKIINTLGDYPDAMRKVAKEENVPLLDLNAMSKTLFESWGEEYSKKAFVHYPANTFPGQSTELKDDTHFNTYGAYELCKCIVKAISLSNLPLKALIVKDFKGFDPAKPDLIENVYLPASPLGDVVVPDGN
ncbi:rhamnogalacturonan acetylesterase [Pinibacter soli]|uniref:Rhamnogalacturonan acetylesterase n=1 Tax=Pinibacter soli TaxID=3044211 RepID=A0ABT6R9K4_9BACT|nr:rhamnogalacturonan acetylesterase [Pinibacter soli]MDI3319239.1 rhamnogalacturonan acetylesterase [Pinibacter soli]